MTQYRPDFIIIDDIIEMPPDSEEFKRHFEQSFKTIFGGECTRECKLYDGDTCRCGLKHPHDEGVHMEMKEVKSSQIHSIGHDPEKNVLAVRFKSGGMPGATYHYEGVTADQHSAFVAAESIGKHFHKNLRSIAGVKQP